MKFYNIPLSYLSIDGLSYIASAVGKPLFVDKLMKKLEPMNFARVCIEISLASALPSSIDLVVIDEESNSEKIISVRVEYQNKPQLYSHCKTFGYSLVRCPRANYKWILKTQVVIAPATLVPRPSPDRVQHSGPSPAPIPIPSQTQDWTLVSKGPKEHYLSSPIAGADQNSFHTLGLPGGILISQTLIALPLPILSWES